MTIETKNGYSRSSRTREEEESLLEQAIANMSKEELETLRAVLEGVSDPKKSQERQLLSQMSNMDYVRKPVDMRTFVHDEYYLGNTCASLYPRLLDDLVELFEGRYSEAIFTGAIGWGKCLEGDTLVFDDKTGCRLPIRDLVDRKPMVPSLAPEGALIHTEASKVWMSGVKPCIRATLDSGQKLDASYDHPVLTPSGYLPMAVLKPGSLVACARYLPEPTYPSTLDDEWVLLCATALSLSPPCPDPSQEDEKINPFEGSKFSGKGIPSDLFGLPNRQTAIMLKWLFVEADIQITLPCIELVLPSVRILEDTQYLLHRFGVIARIRKGVLRIEDPADVLLFLDAIGDGIPGQEEQCKQLYAAAERSLLAPDLEKDIVPIGRKELKELRKSLGRTDDEEWEACTKFVNGGEYLTRRQFERLCRRYRYRGKLWHYSHEDLVWERVVSVEDRGKRTVYDLTVPETANVEANGLIVHNTFTASIGVCRCLYELSCMRDPQRSFGIASNSNISIVCLSVNEDLAMKVAYENIAGKIEASPYFQEHYPFKKTKKELRFPGKVIVAARATTDNSVLGLNVVGGLLDESNFMRKRKSRDPRFNLEDHAQVLYNAMMRRMKSRFGRKGELPGTLFVVSSKQTHDDFTAKRVSESSGDPSVFVRDYALWDVKPDIYYMGDWFHVVVGNEQSPSRILAIDEDPVEVESLLTEGCILIRVPEDYRNDFERDLEGSIRDLAGCATVSVSPFIQRRDKIVSAVDPTRKHPFSTEVYDPSSGGSFKWGQMVRSVAEADLGLGHLTTTHRPLVNPHAPRHIHIDPSLTGDATGFCMGHVAGFKSVVRRDEEGFKHQERAPIIYIDLVLRIVPPIGDEIMMGDVRRFVYQLSKHGYLITLVTMDSWQSAEAIQKLNSKGFKAEVLSVDKTTEPYEYLKSALYEDRLNLYEYPTLTKELRELQHDRIKKKVDHPPRGSKDISDAVAGVCHTLIERSSNLPISMLVSEPVPQDAWMQEHKQRSMAQAYSPYGDGVDEDESIADFHDILPPFILGSDDGS
jgi:hypothetical protein